MVPDEEDMKNWEAIDTAEIPALVAHSIEEGIEVIPAEQAGEFLDRIIAFYEAWDALLEKVLADNERPMRGK